MAQENKGAVYVAIESGAATVNGQEISFIKGITRVRQGHPLLKGRSQFFAKVDDAVHYEWEAATAAPNEKRGA